MERTRFYELLDACPVIAAAKNEESLHHSLDADCRVVFVLYGNVANIPDIVARIDEAGKTPVVHIDLVDGWPRASPRSTISVCARRPPESSPQRAYCSSAPAKWD